jgi:hypothetical protein
MLHSTTKTVTSQAKFTRLAKVVMLAYIAVYVRVRVNFGSFVFPV